LQSAVLNRVTDEVRLGGCELYFHRFQGKGEKQGVKPGWVALAVSFSLVKQAIAVEHSPLASATLTTPSGSRFVPEFRPAKTTSTPLNKAAAKVTGEGHTVPIEEVRKMIPKWISKFEFRGHPRILLGELSGDR
jgi:hypothetical protein